MGLYLLMSEDGKQLLGSGYAETTCIKAELQVYYGVRVRIGEKSFLVDIPYGGCDIHPGSGRYCGMRAVC